MNLPKCQCQTSFWEIFIVYRMFLPVIEVKKKKTIDPIATSWSSMK